MSLEKLERRRPAGRPRWVSEITLLKWIGGDYALQLGPDVGGVTRRCGGNHDAADGSPHHIAGHLMEVVVTDGRDVIVDNARPRRCRGSDVR